MRAQFHLFRPTNEQANMNLATRSNTPFAAVKEEEMKFTDSPLIYNTPSASCPPCISTTPVISRTLTILPRDSKTPPNSPIFPNQSISQRSYDSIYSNESLDLLEDLQFLAEDADTIETPVVHFPYVDSIMLQPHSSPSTLLVQSLQRKRERTDTVDILLTAEALVDNRVEQEFDQRVKRHHTSAFFSGLITAASVYAALSTF
jgi:hypothetical protein